jgi:hypothetical protein
MRKDHQALSFNATQYLAPYEQKRVSRPVSLTLTENTYPLAEFPERSWVSIAFKAFSRLTNRIQTKDLLIVGTGNGLDALGAIEIFDLDSITVTDIFEESLSVAQENIFANLKDKTQIKKDFYTGDLLSCVPAEKQFCLIYENLPNLPAPKDLNLEAGINSASFFDPEQHKVPELFDSYLLALHYLCLQQAHSRVRKGGGVLTSIGGRIPLEIVFKLHRECGYSPELIVYDLKIQSEPDEVIPGYCKAEEQNGVEFKYYAPEALEIVASIRRKGLEGKELADAVEEDLNRYSMSAHEALDRYHQGKEVAHSVFMVFGERCEIASQV